MHDSLNDYLSTWAERAESAPHQHALEELVIAVNAVSGAVYAKTTPAVESVETEAQFELVVVQGDRHATLCHPRKTDLRESFLRGCLLKSQIPLWIDALTPTNIRGEFEEAFFTCNQHYPVEVAIPIVKNEATVGVCVLVWRDHSFSRTGIRRSLCRALDNYWKHLPLDRTFENHTVRSSEVWDKSVWAIPSDHPGTSRDLGFRNFGSAEPTTSSVPVQETHATVDNCRLRHAFVDTIASDLSKRSSDASILKMIQAMARAGGFQRGGVLQNVELDGQPGVGGWKILHEWAEEPTTFQCEVLPGVLPWESFSDFSAAAKMFEQGKPVAGGRSSLPPKEQAMMASIGALYTVNVPIFMGGSWWGVLAFDDCRNERHRSPEELNVLLAAAHHLSYALCEHQGQLHQQRLEEKLSIERELALVSRLEAGERANAMIRKCATRLTNTDILGEVVGEIIQAIFEAQANCEPLFVALNRPGDEEDVVNIYGVRELDCVPTLQLSPQKLRSLQAQIEHTDYTWMAIDAGNVRDLLQRPDAWSLASGVRSLTHFSLPSGEGRSGYLMVFLKAQVCPSEQEVAAIEALVHQLVLALELEELAAQVRRATRIEERNQLARDVHDTLAQSFLGIFLQLTKLEKQRHNPAEMNKELATAMELAKHGLSEARRSLQVLRGLAPPTRDIPADLRSIIDYFAKVSPITIELQIDTPARAVPYLVGESVARIASEAVGNAVRHSQASLIKVELQDHSSKVVLRVTDNGVGFSETPARAVRYGFLGMRERSELIGANLDITSAIGQGTIVELVITLDCLERNEAK